MKHISLFSGIGGIDIAAEWAGFETVLFCEKDDYCQKVLNKHWPNVPIIGDIRDVTRKSTNQPITLITGGVPCQPASVAGKRKGTEDDRWLWPEAIRVVSEIKPTWVVFENVSGILTLENGVVFDNLLSELEGQGYETQSFFIPACGVNAPHRRYRVFIVGNSRLFGQAEYEQQATGIEQSSEDATYTESRESREQEARNRGQGISRGGQEDVTDSERQGLEGADTEGDTCPGGQPCEHGQRGWQGDWWAVEPELGRVAHGIPHRVDRLKCLGNAVVPQQIYPILKAIAEIERGDVL